MPDPDSKLTRPSVEGPKSSINRGFIKSNPATFAKVVDLINEGPKPTLEYKCVDGQIDVIVSYELIRKVDFEVKKKGFIFMVTETITFIFHTDRPCPEEPPSKETLQQIFVEELLRFVLVLPLPLYTATAPLAPDVRMDDSGVDGAISEDLEPLETRALLVDGGVVQLIRKGFCGLPEYDDANKLVRCQPNPLCKGECHVIGGPADGDLRDLGKEAELVKGWVYYCDCV